MKGVDTGVSPHMREPELYLQSAVRSQLPPTLDAVEAL